MLRAAWLVEPCIFSAVLARYIHAVEPRLGVARRERPGICRALSNTMEYLALLNANEKDKASLCKAEPRELLAILIIGASASISSFRLPTWQKRMTVFQMSCG